MSEVDEAISYVFVWHALSDACSKCQALNGSEFRDQNIFQNTLWSASGDIWDLDINQSVVHPNCRCQLEVRVSFDWNKIREIGELQNILQNAGLPHPKFDPIEQVIPTVSEARREVDDLKNGLREAIPTISEFNQLTTTYLSLARKTGLPENIVQAGVTLQQFRVTLQLATRSAQLLMAATGPWGIALGLGGFALSTIMLIDQMSLRRNRY